ncbi:E3 ubiquitin protein ligase RNFT1-like protein [Tanacetum coccineum]
MALFKMKASINGAEVFSVDVLQEQQRAKSPKAGSNVDFGGVLIDVLTSIVEKVQSFISAIKALSRKEIHYGAYATSEQVKAAGDLCTICQEKMHAPVVLRCKHVFCEECVSEWSCYQCISTYCTLKKHFEKPSFALLARARLGLEIEESINLEYFYA